ncbi:unnamed protein product [Pelagomonas calceolata]|uniref:Uncharacterized protein n=1 Tax=Pelagomonas calceolata TaxID=35677 RepID=A0A8J2SCH6_9STRA|nr:unnamed protein product [Pelagomonas calceolata]
MILASTNFLEFWERSWSHSLRGSNPNLRSFASYFALAFTTPSASGVLPLYVFISTHCRKTMTSRLLLRAIFLALRAHKTNRGSSILSPQYSRALLYMALGPSSLDAYLCHARMRCKHLLAMACLEARCLCTGSSVTSQAFVRSTWNHFRRHLRCMTRLCN